MRNPLAAAGEERDHPGNLYHDLSERPFGRRVASAVTLSPRGQGNQAEDLSDGVSYGCASPSIVPIVLVYSAGCPP